MSQVDRDRPERVAMSQGRKLFIAWTIFSALAVWFALAIAEGLAAERCLNDGQAWKWKTWSCARPTGTIILPPGLRRAGSD